MKVLSLNVWNNAERVENGFEKTARVIELSEAEVVLLQEAETVAAPLADRLKMNAVTFKSSPAILSRYPVRQTLQMPHAVAAIVENAGELWGIVSLHLSAYPYGPYELCFDHKREEDVTEMEMRIRGVELKRILTSVESFFSGVDKVIVGGDFNAPSHLDWTDEARQRHCGYNIQFPTSHLMQESGFVDAYRGYFPDPVLHPGNTWAPFEKWNAQRNREEPQDRIDLIHFRGGLTVKSARVVADEHSLWPTDHAGLLIEFKNTDLPTEF